MPRLDTVEEEVTPVHLLLIAPTKFGKSTYTAEAALAGFNVLYIDADNGKSTLIHTLKGNPEALARIHHVQTTNPAQFLEAMFEATKVFRWNLTTDKVYMKATAAPDDVIFTLDIQKFFEERDLILAVDSWTTVAYNALKVGAGKAGAKVQDFKEVGQAVYGTAGNLVNYLCVVLQQLPMHVIVQAHLGFYERYSKPAKVANPKQKEMILEETLEVPISTSNPQSDKMGKYFNHIGHLTVDNIGRRLIDFTTKPRRTGGGPPNRIAPTTELGFAQLTQPPKNPKPFPVEVADEVVASEIAGTKPVESGKPEQPLKLSVQK